MFGYAPDTSCASILECPNINATPEVQMSQVSLKRLRKIVERQKLNHSEESVYDRNSSWDDVVDRFPVSHIDGSISFPGAKLPAQPLAHSRRVLRKVSEGAPPMAYKGFSVVNPGSHSSPKSLLGSSLLRKQDRSPDSQVRKKVRRLEPKPCHCPLKRFVAVSNNPTEKVMKQRCGSSRNRRKTDKSRTVCSVKQPPKREILGAESSSDKVCKLENMGGNDLHAAAIDRERHSELNVLEQVRQILATDKCQSAGHQQGKADESRDGLPRRGIYRSERKNKQLVKNPEPLPEEVCRRQRGLSRADLQALVRKQRQDRKLERLNKERAERERRERIHQNLCATARAAAVAAKAPLPGPRRPLVLTDRTAGTTAHHSCFDPEVHLPNDYSSERQRKLDALLNGDYPVSPWSPHLQNDLSITHQSRWSHRSGSRWTSRAAFSEDYLTSDSPISSFRSPICGEVPLGSIVRPHSPSRYDRTACCSFRRKSDFNSHPNSQRKPSGHVLKPSDSVWIPLSCHVPDPGQGSTLHTPAVNFDPLEFHADDEDRVSPVSSLDEVDQFRPDSAHWMRLEAVGASEPETSSQDGQEDHFVDDLRSSDFNPTQLERRVDDLLRLSRAPLDTDAFVCTELAALHHTDDLAYVDLRHWIYNDPLRLGILRKQQERTGQKESLVHEHNASLKLTQPSHRAAGPASVEPTNVAYIERSPVSRSTHHPVEDSRARSLADHHVSPPSSILGIPTKSTTPTISLQAIPTSSPSGQQDFIAGAASRAISSTPRRDTSNAISLTQEAPQPQVEIHGDSLPPRLTATALSLRLSEEVNHLEALACSIQHVTEMESLRQYAGAQSEAVTLAQVLRNRQTQENIPNPSRSPKLHSPFKYPSTHSQATSVTPSKLQSDAEAHSPQFTEVIRAAEEFKKAERRLSTKTSKMEDLITKKSMVKESVSSSVVHNLQTPRGDNQSHSTSTGHSASSVIHHVELSPTSATRSSKSVPEVDSEIHSVSEASFAPGSMRSLPTDISGPAGDNSPTEDNSSTLISQEQSADGTRSVSTALTVTRCTGSKHISEVSSDSMITVQSHTGGEVVQTIHSSPSKHKMETHQNEEGVPHPADSSAHREPVVESSRTPHPNSITPFNRTEDGSEDVLSLTQIDSGLLRRAAMLKLRRERAEKLLALSKNLEQEEAEVVRLEKKALKAYQTKRKKTRIEELRHGVSKTSVDRATNASSTHFDQRINIMDVPHRSHYSNALSTALARDSAPNVDELSNLSGVDLISHSQVKTTSTRARGLSRLGLSVKSPPYDARTSKTISASTGLRNTTGSCVSKADTSRYSHDFIHSSESFQEVVPTSSSVENKRSLKVTAGQVEWSKRNDIENDVSVDRSNADPVTPRCRKHLGSEFVSSSSDRSTSSAHGRSSPTKTRQMSTTEYHKEYSSPARRRLLSASAVSSTDDDERKTEIPPDDSVAASASSQIDLSAMESRIRALHSNLQCQEAILARINQRHKFVSTDRLARFESTVMQHKQLCTEIIESIKKKLRECESNATREFPNRPSPGPPREPTPMSISHKVPAVASGPQTDQTFSSSSHSSSRTFGGNSQPPTLASLAEDLVSATDTEGDLQKLEFDEKVESVASSRTLTDGTRTPEHESAGSILRPHSYSPDFEQPSGKGPDSVMGSVHSPFPSARNTTSATVPDDGIHTPAALTLSPSQLNSEVNARMNMLSVNSAQSIQTECNDPELNWTVSKRAEESRLPLGDNAVRSKPVLSQAALGLPSLSEVNMVTVDEPSPGQVSTTIGEIRMNDAARQSLSRISSIKVGSISNLSPPGAEAARAQESTIMATTITSKESLPLSIAGPAHSERIQITVPEPTHESAVSTPESSPLDHTDLAENLTQELFGKVLSDVVDEAVHAREAISSSRLDALRENKGDSIPLHESDSAKTVPDRGPVVELPEPGTDSITEVDSPSDTDSLSDTAEASLNIAPSMFSPENVRGLVADFPSRLEPLIQEALDYFWQARSNAPEGTRESAIITAMAAPPARFGFDVFEEADLSPELLSLPNLRFISRRLLFDLVCELIQQTYAGEDHEFTLKQSGNPVRPRVSSMQFRLWQGQNRPSDKEHLARIVTSGVQTALCLRSDKLVPASDDLNEFTDLRRFPGKLTSGTRFSRLAQWTLSKKSYLDRLLELELRNDEGNWLSYVPEEQRLKRNLSDQIWNEVVQDSVDSMLKRWRASHNITASVIPETESVK